MQATKSAATRRANGMAVAVLLGIVAFVCAMCFTVHTAWAKDGTWAGSGTQDDPYLIEDAADLKALSDSFNDPNDFSMVLYRGNYFKMTTDIDMSGDAAFAPIGSSAKYFGGNFDGGGFAVTVNFDSTDSYQALFGAIEGTEAQGASVTNLVVRGSVSGKATVAGICGRAAGYVTFSRCGNEAAITATSSPAAGIVAEHSSAGKPVVVDECYNKGAVKSGGSSLTGGIVGKLQYGAAGAPSKVSNSYNTGAVETSAQWAGGIAGQIVGGTVTGEKAQVVRIENCYSTGEVKTSGTEYGGIVGVPATMNFASSFEKLKQNTVVANCYTTLSQAVSPTITSFMSDAKTTDQIMTWEDKDNAVKTVDQMAADDIVSALNAGGASFAKGEASPRLSWEQSAPAADLEIATKDEFIAFVDAVNAGGSTFAGKLVVLTEDIDMGGAEMYPIGYRDATYYLNKRYFEGTFDGQGHTISNINIVPNPDSYYYPQGDAGLFGFVKGAGDPAVIKNVVVSGTVSASGQYAGGVVGNASNVRLENVGSLVNVTTSREGVAYAGGLVGGVTNTLEVAECYARGRVSASAGTFAGGLVGGMGRIEDSTGNGNTTKCVIENSYSTAAVCAADYAGGLVGGVTQGQKGASSAWFANCYAAGELACEGEHAGALLGLTGSDATGENLHFLADEALDRAAVGGVDTLQVPGYPEPNDPIVGTDNITAASTAQSAESMGSAKIVQLLGVAFASTFPAYNATCPLLAWESDLSDAYALVTFLPGEHGVLFGSATQWVLKGSAFALVAQPRIVADEGYWVADAMWEPVLDPASAVTESVTFTAQYRSKPVYTDIPADHWVRVEGWLDRVVERNLMTGHTDDQGNLTGRFGPEEALTRAQVAVILYRHACSIDESLEQVYGSTTSKDAFAGESVFEDVAAHEYYTAAINWARAEGIMKGDEPDCTKVRPNDDILRGELALMIQRYAESLGAGVAADGSYQQAPDAQEVPDYFAAGIDWCYTNGIMTGKAASGELTVFAQATRAEMAKIIVSVAECVEAGQA